MSTRSGDFITLRERYKPYEVLNDFRTVSAFMSADVQKEYHGEYFGKVAVAPASSELIALSGRSLDLLSHPDAIREGMRRLTAVLNPDR